MKQVGVPKKAKSYVPAVPGHGSKASGHSVQPHDWTPAVGKSQKVSVKGCADFPDHPLKQKKGY